ncbi:MAG TPA: hypothetical protein VMR59_00465 [Patescibacteria group bacterium]|jgi:hypothetical protein|nr:hypothetical protein [Patescibacteria group bacterium]
MVNVEINPAVAHIIIEPVKGLIYSFGPDGSVLVAGREHRYFSQTTQRSAREIGFVEDVPFKDRVARSKKETRAAVNTIFDTLLSPAV